MMRYVEPHRLRVRRVIAAFRAKRGQIQASGAENVSELRISMRSIWIYGRFGQILAKYGLFLAGKCKKSKWYGGVCGESWLKPESAESAGFGKDCDPQFQHALLHPQGWAADLNAPRIPPTPKDLSVFAGPA